MPRTTRRSATTLVLAAGLAGLAGLTGCRGGGGGVAASGTAAPEVPTTTSTSVASAGSSTTRRSGTTVRSTSSSKAARPATTTAAGASGPPKVAVPNQGDGVVAVFVATGASLDEPSFSRAIARLQALGYPSYSGGDTGCSRGAKEALPQLGQYSVSVEFATQSEAERFAALYGDVIGIAAVAVYCAD